MLPPPEVTAQATCTPGVGLPYASRTCTANESSTTEPTTPTTLLSATASARVGAPGTAVALKVANTSAWPVTLSTARTSSVCGPAAVPSVQRSCATPSSLVALLPANTCPPPAVTTKFTTCPFTAWPLASVTFTPPRRGRPLAPGAGWGVPP